VSLADRVLTRENAVIAVCVVAATALYVGLGSAFPTFPQWALFVVLIGVGVLLPGYVTGRYGG
jgi:hypothetical protein